MGSGPGMAYGIGVKLETKIKRYVNVKTFSIAFEELTRRWRDR